MRQEELHKYEQKQRTLQAQWNNLYAQELQKQRPAPPWEFSSQQEKKLQAQLAVDTRIAKELALHKQQSLQRQKDFLRHPEKGVPQKERASSTMPRAPASLKNERLKETFRRIVATRDQKQRGKERDDR